MSRAPSHPVIAQISNFNWTEEPSAITIRQQVVPLFSLCREWRKFARLGRKNMSKGGCPSTNFILHELDDSLAAQLRQALSGPGQVLHSTSCTSECLAVVEQLGADIVFCDADPGKYQRLLGALERSGIKAPVVVVSRIPETSEWLDALDAGAAD